MYLNFPIPESNINFKNDIKFEVRFLIAMAIFQVPDSPVYVVTVLMQV